tara:strand:- start:573 stop:1337 length:765 start_codon:yes stop_codon:yes gene_type:complete
MDKIEEFNSLKDKLENLFSDKSNIEIEKIIEHFMCTNILHNENEIKDWYETIVRNLDATIENIDVNDCNLWDSDSSGNIEHSSKQFFRITGIRVNNSSSREVGDKGWDQPILSEVTQDGGLLGLVRSYIKGLPHYLIEAKFEPGNYNLIQLSPTLQATFSNLNRAHGGKKPNYSEFFDDYETNEEDYIFNQWLSEDGGRLFNKRNLGLVKNIDYKAISNIEENFHWISLYQIKNFLNKGTYVNPHLARLIFMYQ